MLRQTIGLVLILAILSQDLCPDSTEKKCQGDITIAYEKCEKAAQEKGKDQHADVDCVKYFTSMSKQCWPCICQIAKKQGWKIKGCDTIDKIKQIISDYHK